MSDPFPTWMSEEDEPDIFFETEEIDFILPNADRISGWIKAVIDLEEKQLHQLTYIFCSDEYLHELNLEYLDHDTYTDIITFPYSEPPLIEGDIFISIGRVRDNAAQLDLTFEEELHRVMIHGVLHLCGYADKSPEEAQRMRQKENIALRMLSEP